MSRFVDLTGKKFNHLTVIERTKNNKHNQSQWVCQCDCGNRVIVVGGHLKNGHTKSCGCLKAESGNVVDLVGRKFNKLIVIKRVKNSGKHTMWKCRCDCGNETIVRADDLKSGCSKSCGCYAREMATILNTSHGGTGTRLYNIWNLMKDRCLNPNNKRYECYGGRGITVCEEWMEFEPFRDWSMSNGYADNLTIDRKDNDGNYEPSNCRWATHKEQANNRSNNHYLTYNGETHTIAEWAEIKGINKDVLRSRINIGWQIERAFNEKVTERKHQNSHVD